MAKKNQTDKPELSPHELLEARVDAMMDTNLPATTVPIKLTPTPEPVPETEATPVVLNVAADATPGAPALVRKTAIGASPKAAQPPILITEAEPTSQLVPDMQPQAITIRPLNIDTPQSDAAIDDIVAQEADEVLAAEDAGLAQAQTDAVSVDESKKRGHPVFWFFVVLLVILAVIAAVVLINPNLNLPFST